jgi:3-methyl-2-oxobutanoate hydroxymethyltransferase
MAKKVTLKTVYNAKASGEKLSMLTAYDYSTAKHIDEAGVDMILVGDSLAQVVLGYDATYHVGMEEMKIFTSAVCRGAKRALVAADMPFMSYHADVSEGVRNAGELIRCGANAVKLEGATDHILEVVKRCVESGVPVMGHLGFTPQSVQALGGYTVQGKSYEATLQILEQAQKLEKAGAFAVVLEMLPEESAKYITEHLNISTVSCGAGRWCDAQVIVSDDAFGKYSDFKPKFARRYGDMHSLILDCARRYDTDVKNGNFPAEEEIFKLSEDELKMFYLHSGK